MEEIAESFASCLSKQTGTGGVYPGQGANVSYEDLSEINTSMEPESIFFTPLYALILTDLLKKYEYIKIVNESVSQSYSSLRGLHLRVMLLTGTQGLNAVLTAVNMCKMSPLWMSASTCSLWARFIYLQLCISYYFGLKLSHFYFICNYLHLTEEWSVTCFYADVKNLEALTWLFEFCPIHPRATQFPVI